LLVGTAAAIGGCRREAPMTTAEDGDGEIPEMVTHNVTMLVSDSGVIRYKAITDLWIRYKPTSGEPYQLFPEGIYLEQLDSLFNPTASIQADTAYNYETTRRWHLINNVHIVNSEEEHFYTNDLHWDMNRHAVYSDSLIRIVRPDATLIGYGFRSDDRFTEYTIMNPAGDFPMQSIARGDSASGLHQAMMDSVADAAHEVH
jgi:LPS export ABC transporter protein LptC